MFKLIALIGILLPYISYAQICLEDGLVENPNDKTSYYECLDGKSYFKRCPLAEDRLSYKIFDGKSCIESNPVFVCPQETGNYRYMNDERQYYECVDSKPVLKNCPEDSKFDGLRCVSTVEKEEEEEDQSVEVFNCPEPNGLFYNEEDKHSYFECKDSVPDLKDCPRESKGHRSHHKHHHRRRLIFDGEKCVPEHQNLKDGRQSRQVPLEDADFECPEPNGYFENPNNPYTYYTCRNNIPRVDRCPENRRFNQTLRQCVYAPTHFVGPNVRPEQPVLVDTPIFSNQETGSTCPEGSVFDRNTRKCRIETFVDPNRETRPVVDRVQRVCPEGSYYDVGVNKCRREVLVEPILRRVEVERPATECPVGYTFDPQVRRCKSVIFVEPRSPVIEAEPQCAPGSYYNRSLGRCIGNRCPVGYSWDASSGTCIQGRYRRNGRVETEDRLNGNVIVDTWNEAQWKWERDLNGDRILPDVNGWLDRSVAYRHGGRAVDEENRKK